MAKCIKALGCPQEKIRVHHLGVEVDRLPFKPRLWHPGKPLRILISASFREKKGIPYALDAIGQLMNEVDIEVTIIGDATSEESSRAEKKRILHLIEKYNLHSRVQMLGFKPYSVLMKQAYNHHIFLSPSVSAEDGDTEGGAPVTIIEMIATGMPVISTIHCDIPEVINYGRERMLSPERNAARLTDCIQWWLQHTDSWTILLSHARKHVENKYDVHKQAINLGNIYRSL
jgi:colanic acid/amylovoran biosynthesis glycosyltransferase